KIEEQLVVFNPVDREVIHLGARSVHSRAHRPVISMNLEKPLLAATLRRRTRSQENQLGKLSTVERELHDLFRSDYRADGGIDQISQRVLVFDGSSETSVDGLSFADQDAKQCCKTEKR